MPSEVSVRTHAKALKNEDAVVAVAARAAGLEVEFLRVVEDGYGYSTKRAVDKLPKKASFGVTRYVDGGFRTKTMSEDDLMDLGPEYDDGEYTWVGDRRGVKGAIRDVQICRASFW